MSAPGLFCIAFGVVCFSALATWLWHLKLKNAGVIDLVWGLNLAVTAVVYALLGPGWLPRRIAIAAMVTLTGLRLSYYLGRRVLSHPEESRYVALRQEWAPAPDAGWWMSIEVKFLAFFLFQSLLVGLLSMPYLLACLNATAGFHPLEFLAIGLFVIGFIGESLADAQLKAFKARPETKAKTCRDGLWQFSRHPNYFFEWVMWLSYFVYACASPYGWLTFYAPALMLHFLLNVTGVKATEEQCLRSRGVDYAKYQRETSMFIPWFPKP
jgi:steroid 5-alpha reductase family enzyme